MHCMISIDSSVGSISLTKIEVQGKIVLEVVRMHSEPPWFSGIRLFFPDAPEIQIEVETAAALGLDAVIDFRTRVEQIVAHKLLDLVKDNAVLPNCIAHRTSSELDHFSLKHIYPEGVLTIKLLSSTVNLETCSGMTVQESEVCVGAESKVLKPLEKADFLVCDRRRQMLRLTAIDSYGAVIGRTACDISELADAVRFVDGECITFSEHCLQLKSTEPEHSYEGVYINIATFWREIKGPYRTSANNADESRISIDRHTFQDELSFEKKWLLVVDLFNACCLPPVESGTMHWVTVKVFGPCGVQKLEDSPAEPCQTPMEEGLKLIAPEFREFLQQKLSPADWRQMLGRKPSSGVMTLSGQARDLVDATWEHRFRDLITVRSSMVESVRSTKIVASVWRSTAGRESDPKSCKVKLGSASYKLDALLLKEDSCDNVSLRLQEGPASPLGQLRLRIQICPVRVPDVGAGSKSL